MAGEFQTAVAALTTAPDLYWKFDETAGGSLAATGGTCTMLPLSNTYDAHELPGLMRDTDEHALWLTPTAQGMPSWYVNGSTALDSSGWTEGAIAFAYMRGTDEASVKDIWELQYGSSSTHTTIYLDTSHRLNIQFAASGKSYHVRTDDALDDQTMYWIAIIQRADTNGIKIRINGSDWATTTVAQTGTGVGNDSWFQDIYSSAANGKVNWNNLNSATTGSYGGFGIFARPMVWTTAAPSNADIDSLYTACKFTSADSSAVNLFQFALDLADSNGLHYFVMPRTVDDTAIDSEFVTQYQKGRNVASSGSGFIRSGSSLGSTSIADDEDNASTNFKYPEWRTGTTGTPILQCNTPANFDEAETTGTWMLCVDYNDGAPASDKGICGTTGNASTNYCKLGITSGGQLYWHFHNGTNFIKRTCDNALGAGYHVVGIVQDGVDAVLYVDGVAQAVTDSGTLDGTQWIANLPISTTIRTFNIAAGPIFGDDMAKQDFGTFVAWENALTADEVSDWYDAIVNDATFPSISIFATKTIRRTGRRLFSPNTPAS